MLCVKFIILIACRKSYNLQSTEHRAQILYSEFRVQSAQLRHVPRFNFNLTCHVCVTAARNSTHMRRSSLGASRTLLPLCMPAPTMEKW